MPLAHFFFLEAEPFLLESHIYFFFLLTMQNALGPQIA